MSGNNKSFEKSLVRINWLHEGQPSLHCPITGKVVLAGYDSANAEQWDEPDYALIETLRFVYIPDAGEFEYIHPVLEKVLELRVKELKKELGEDAFEEEFESSPWEVLCAEINQFIEMPFVYDLTTHGMACGPVSFSVFAGIELAPLNGDD
jgi:hypothetical protein